MSKSEDGLRHLLSSAGSDPSFSLHRVWQPPLQNAELREEAFGMGCAKLLLCRGGGTIVDARRRVWLVDGRGVITRSRADAEALPDHVLPYCHDGPSHPDIKAAVAALKPSVLIGISEGSQGITFCQDVCQRLATAHERPILMPLSLSGQSC